MKSFLFGRRIISLLLTGMLLLQCTLTSVAQEKGNDIYLADPTIFYHQGTYYLYGTVGGNANDGFMGYTSNDLQHWLKSKDFALKKGEVFGTAGFWAPQIFAMGDSFYMAYVANEQMAIAKSKSPGGPFLQEKKDSLASTVKQIDPFVFIDDDGKKYLYHVRLQKGNRIFVAEMESDLSGIKENTLKECITATDTWENTAHAPWPVTEGPSVLKRGNTYYLFYTANDFRNPDYAVGYATATSPYGPWKKYAGNPIIDRKNIGINGPGHGDFVIDGQKNLQYVFHTHFSDSTVAPRRTTIVGVKFSPDAPTGIDKMVIDKKSFHFLRSN